MPYGPVRAIRRVGARLSRVLRATGRIGSSATAQRTASQASNESELAWPARRLSTCSSKLSLSNRETPAAIDDKRASSMTWMASALSMAAASRCRTSHDHQIGREVFGHDALAGPGKDPLWPGRNQDSPPSGAPGCRLTGGSRTARPRGQGQDGRRGRGASGATPLLVWRVCTR